MRAVRVAVTSVSALAGTVYLVCGSALFSVDVWVPMSFLWLGWYVILDHWAKWNPPLLPAAWFGLRRWETNGLLYERAGVRGYSRIVTNGRFDLRSSGRRIIRSRRDVGEWSNRTRFAETGHVVHFVLLLPAIAAAASHADVLVCSALIVLTIVFNVYAIFLQRYNRSRAAHVHRLTGR